MTVRTMPILGLLLLGVVGHATAQVACPAGSTRVMAVGPLVAGNTLCAVRGSDRWQEQHRGSGSNGELWDYKLGPGNPVDPTKVVGTWSATNGANSSLTHTYTGGSSFSWLVCQVGTTYTLVSTGTAGTITGATVLAGQTSCP